MRILRISILLLLLLPLAFNSCRKHRTFHYFIPEKVRELLLFKDSTYWIYQNQGNSGVDSVWQTSHEEVVRTSNYGDKTTILYHDFSTTYSKKYASGSTRKGIRIFSTIQFDPARLEDGIASVEIYHQFTKNQHYDPYMMYPFGEAAYAHKGSKVDTIFNELSVAGNLYYNVLRFYTFSHEDGELTYLYFAPKVGLIRKDLLASGKIWELVRYKIK